MLRKYDQLDSQLFAWLRQIQGVSKATTSGAIEALSVTCSTAQRHISRRFSQLEDRGVLVCSLHGTTRICEVVKDPPETLAKERWKPKRSAEPVSTKSPSIRAANSQEFEAAGGTIQRLPTYWDKPIAAKAIGAMTFQDFLSTLD